MPDSPNVPPAGKPGILPDLNKYWPTIVSAAAGLVAFLTPSVNAWLANPSHTAYAAVGACAWAIVCHRLQSPVQKAPK
jgi:hypothetical protein